MQFLKISSLKLQQQIQTKSTFLNSKQQRKTQKLKITCCKHSSDLIYIMCGLNDGSIMQFQRKKHQKRFNQNKQYEVKRFTFANQHKGQIKCILVENIFKQNFIITGSADRTIKIWDTEPKTKDIVQTLSGHLGTILCLAYSKKSDTLFSGSTDKIIRIWRQQEGRKYFSYPGYICYQTISQFNPKKSESPVYPTSFDIQDGQMNNFTLFVGDSTGNLHITKQIQLHSLEQYSGKIKTQFEIDKSNYGYHRLNINNILYVPKQHLVLTSSYDQQIYGFQSLSDKLILKFSNPRKCIFTSLIWYQNMLIASDQQGYLYCIEINSDRPNQQIKKYNTKILQLVSIKQTHQILVVTEQFVDVIKITRGIKAVEGDSCHKDAIIGIFSLQPYKITDKKVKDVPKIISVSLDNTMRVWDPVDLTCLQILYNNEKAQISSLFYLKRANLFVTGHDNGAVKLWNIELETSITISQKNSPYAHKNNISSFSQYIYIHGTEDVTQFMFSAGYEGKINVWQIFIKRSAVQNSLMSSIICPQLKYSFFPNDQQQNADQIGYELFCLATWQKQSKEQTYIISAGSKGQVYFNRMFTYETINKIKIHDDTINCMIIDQNILFTGSYDKTIKMMSLENFEELNVLKLHNASINRIQMLSTGHLISQSSDGQILFWDYTSVEVIKKIKQKKQTILCICNFDQLEMLYVGTQQAKIISYPLKDLYQNKTKVSRQIEDDISQQSLQRMVKENEEELALMLNNQR